MDSTELHYLTYDPEEIWEEMMVSYVEAGGDILYPGDEKEILLRSVLADLVQVFAGVDNALRMQTLRYAVGEYLDILGEQRGCERISASAATATVTIQTNATGRSDVLAEGTAMTADGEIFYRLTEDQTLTGYEQTIIADVIADRTGSAGNALAAGAQMHLAVANSAVASILVSAAASGGNEAEDDDTYRERIRTYGLAGVTPGPARQYEAVAQSVSSVILDAKALNLGAGQVGIYLILSDDSAAENVISAVESALSAESVRPLTDQVTVALSEELEYTIHVQYIADTAATTGTAIAAAVSEYQKWQDETVGQAFNPDRLMALIYNAGATRVLWGEGSHFNGGDVVHTPIEPNQHCKGTITLTALPS